MLRSIAATRAPALRRESKRLLPAMSGQAAAPGGVDEIAGLTRGHSLKPTCYALARSPRWLLLQAVGLKLILVDGYRSGRAAAVAHQIRMRRPAPKMSRPSQANVASIASESSEISMRRIATRLMLSKNGRTSRYSTSDMTRRPTDKNLSPNPYWTRRAGAAARGICQNVLTGNLHGRDTAAPRRRRISGRTGKRSGRGGWTGNMNLRRWVKAATQ